MCVVDTNRCACIGHLVPGVLHVAACCNEPHIEDMILGPPGSQIPHDPFGDDPDFNQVRLAIERINEGLLNLSDDEAERLRPARRITDESIDEW